MNHSRRRRFIASLVIIGISAGLMLVNPENYYSPVPSPQTTSDEVADSPSVRQAIEVLDELDVKGRAPKTGYTRSQFGQGWSLVDGCDMRNIILLRDLADTKVDEQCRILSGRLDDPYTGKVINFERGPSSSQAVQIDHVVALSDAWQKGAQALSEAQRHSLANDPLNLLAVDGGVNQQKSDSDAATWLPSNRAFRCQFVARQIAVKHRYNLWLTKAEHDAMSRQLARCPNQLLPTTTN